MSLKIRRGRLADLPTLAISELGFATDSYDLYIGSDKGNILLNNGQVLLKRLNGMLMYAYANRPNQWFEICPISELKGEKGDKGDRGDSFKYSDFTPEQLASLKGVKGDKGDPGNASVAINDDLKSPQTTWSSEKISSFVDGLIENQDITYKTKTGMLYCRETKSGVLNDFKVKGRTLVNILQQGFKSNTGTSGLVSIDESSLSITGNGQDSGLAYDVSLFKPNKLYTLITTVDSLNVNGKNESWSIFKIGDSDTAISVPNPTTIGTYVCTFTTPNVEKITTASTLFGRGMTSGDSIALTGMLVLDGDFTQYPPSYFEGMLSSCDKSKLEVITVNTNGNLFDKAKVINSKIVSGAENKTKGDFITPLVNPTVWNVTDYIPVFSSDIYIGGLTHSAVSGSTLNYGAFYNSNKEVMSIVNYNITNDNFRVTVPRGARYFAISVNNSDIDSLYVCSNPNRSLEYISDKNEIQYKNESHAWASITDFMGVDENTCDVIEHKKDNKCYLTKNMSKIVFNGSEDWSLVFAKGDVITFRLINSTHITSWDRVTHVCDKFPCGTSAHYGVNCESVILDSSSIFITIDKTKLASENIEGFKTWLKTNNVTLVYKSKTPKVYEVNCSYIDSYDGDTGFILNSGIVFAIVSFGITSSISGLTSLNSRRVKSLEDKVFNITKSLLRGDMRAIAEILYPEDFNKTREGVLHE